MVHDQSHAAHLCVRLRAQSPDECVNHGNAAHLDFNIGLSKPKVVPRGHLLLLDEQEAFKCVISVAFMF